MSRSTLWRHLAFVFSAILLVISISTLKEISFWLLSNKYFLSSWLLVLIIGSWIASYAHKNSLSQKVIARLISLMFLKKKNIFLIYLSHRKGKSPLWIKALFIWSGCPKCMAWWLGGLSSLTMHLLYWPSWGNIYFMLVGSSINVVMALGFYQNRYK